MSLDHPAIFKAYPNVKTILDDKKVEIKPEPEPIQLPPAPAPPPQPKKTNRYTNLKYNFV